MFINIQQKLEFWKKRYSWRTHIDLSLTAVIETLRRSEQYKRESRIVDEFIAAIQLESSREGTLFT